MSAVDIMIHTKTQNQKHESKSSHNLSYKAKQPPGTTVSKVNLMTKDAIVKADKKRCLECAAGNVQCSSTDVPFSRKECAVKKSMSLFGVNILRALFCAKKNAYANEENVSNFVENFLTKRMRKTSSLEQFKKSTSDSHNVRDILKFPEVQPILEEFSTVLNSGDQACKLLSHPLFYKSVNSNNISNALYHEQVLNAHLYCRQPRYMKMSMLQNKTVKTSTIPSSNFDGGQLVPSQKNMGECPVNPYLKLLCVFTNYEYFDGISDDLGKSWLDEDIKMILPITSNIVVAHNVITIYDENKQHIRIYFQNPLKTKVDYQSSKSPASKNNPSNSQVESKHNAGEGKFLTKSRQSKNMNMSQNEGTVVDKSAERIFRQKTVQDLYIKGFNKEGRSSFLPLQVPILFKLTEKTNVKQVLMYKTKSIPKATEEQKRSFYKALEDLLTRSVEYEGEPINLVIEPQKLINKLKTEEQQNNGFTAAHAFMANKLKEKTDLKSLQKVNKTRAENTEFRKLDEIMNKGNMLSTILPAATVSKSLQYLNLMNNLLSPVRLYSDQEVLQKDIARQKPCGRKNRTALKRVNVKEIVTSIFAQFFHFYSLLGPDNLRSGSVITRSNSNYWLKISGVIPDTCTLRLAADLFKTVAE